MSSSDFSNTRPYVDPPYRVAAGFVDITPRDRLPLAGYLKRKAPFTAIADPLEANILVVGTNEGRAALVCVDLLYPGGGLRDAIARAVSDIIPSDHLLVAASHTHFAPATDPLLPRLGLASGAYISMVVERVSDLVRQLANRCDAPAGLYYSTGQAHHAINRRLPVFGFRLRPPFLKTRWEMRPNFEGPRDETIRVLAARDPRHSLTALCWSYGCHPVEFPNWLHVSSDYPGAVRKALRDRFGPIPVLFWQGFSGDVRPCCVRAAAKDWLGREKRPSFASMTVAQWQNWTTSLTQCVVEAIENPASIVAGEISTGRWEIHPSELGLDAPGRTITVQRVAFGQSLGLFGISAEMVADYVRLLQTSMKSTNTIPISCIDGVIGYIPTSSMVGQEGYEDQGFMPLFNVSGRYRPDATDIVATRLFRLTPNREQATAHEPLQG